MASAVDLVEAEVRELVRRRGLDPVADGAQMRRLIDEVVDSGERSLSATMAPLPKRLWPPGRCEPRLAARAVYDAVAGFGPLQRHLDDDTIEEIWTNEHGQMFMATRSLGTDPNYPVQQPSRCSQAS